MNFRATIQKNLKIHKVNIHLPYIKRKIQVNCPLGLIKITLIIKKMMKMRIKLSQTKISGKESQGMNLWKVIFQRK